jgi:acyl-CoA dehydrogenase
LNFDYSEKVQKLVSRLEAFMDELVYPNERVFEEQLVAAESRWITRLCARSWAIVP